MRWKRLTCNFAFLTFVALFVTGDRTKQKIYKDVNGTNYCFRRLNATHQIGCQSERGGNVGVLHYCQEDKDLQWVLNEGPHSPYVVLLTTEMFNSTNLLLIKSSTKINGVLVISNNGTKPQYFSPDKKCPNTGYGRYTGDKAYEDCRNVTWNPQANSLVFEDFNFPIIALTNTSDIDFLINQCYIKYNKPSDSGKPRDYPLCAALAKDRMYAAKDTPTCRRRSSLVQNLNTEKLCDPIGNYNIHFRTHSVNNTETLANDSVIIAAARLDGFSMFGDLVPSVESSAAGIITLLGAAEALRFYLDELKQANKTIMFTLFQGEAFDYTGSSRMVYEMEKNRFPKVVKKDETGPQYIDLNHVHSFVEVSQVALPQDNTMWLHTDPLTTGNTKKQVAEIIEMLKQQGNASGLTIDSAPDAQPLPPASLQSFLKKKAIPGIVISDHQREYNNRYYNSRLDLLEQINGSYPDGMSEQEKYENYMSPAAKHLLKVSITLARTLYTMATGHKNTSRVTVHSSFISKMIYCFMYNQQCELLRAIAPPGGIYPWTGYYHGVQSSSTRAVNMCYYMFIHLYGTNMTSSGIKTKKDCTSPDKKNQEYRYLWVAGLRGSDNKTRQGACFKHHVQTSTAVSPAFDIPDYDWSSNEYSTWTESVWARDAQQLKVFLLPSRPLEIATLCGGIAWLLVSLTIVYLLSKRAGLLFTPPTNTESS